MINPKRIPIILIHQGINLTTAFLIVLISHMTTINREKIPIIHLNQILILAFRTDLTFQNHNQKELQIDMMDIGIEKRQRMKK